MIPRALEACHPPATASVRDGRAGAPRISAAQGRYGGLDAAPRPALVLLNLNMPRKNRHEALRKIKLEPELRTIPVVFFTPSEAEEDIDRSYAARRGGVRCQAGHVRRDGRRPTPAGPALARGGEIADSTYYSNG